MTVWIFDANALIQPGREAVLNITKETLHKNILPTNVLIAQTVQQHPTHTIENLLYKILNLTQPPIFFNLDLYFKASLEEQDKYLTELQSLFQQFTTCPRIVLITSAPRKLQINAETYRISEILLDHKFYLEKAYLRIFFINRFQKIWQYATKPNDRPLVLCIIPPHTNNKG